VAQFFAVEVFGTVRYVDVSNPTPVVPYLTWATAATNIQDAVDRSSPGDIVSVTNGIYQTGGNPFAPTNRVWISSSITVQSVNGPEVTIIRGYQVPGTTNGTSAIRCALLSGGAKLSGFTLTLGASITSGPDFGGGVYCASANATVSNCIIIGNVGFQNGGGAYGGTLINSVLSGNLAQNGAGAYQATLINCVLTDNHAVLGPISSRTGGGAAFCTLNSCLILSNSATLGGGTYSSYLTNCTVVGNLAGTAGGIYLGAQPSIGVSVVNTIAFYNSASNHPNAFINFDASGFSYCCAAEALPGFRNLTNEPNFMDITAGDFRLQPNSPCINSGRNAYIPNITDLDGNPRIAGGTVDIGAYEYQSPSSLLSYAWLQQYGLPTDGSIDYTDPDNDQMNNWQEWIAGTDPTDALSVLRLLLPKPVPTGVTVSWPAVTNRLYFIQRATNLAFQPAFLTLQTNLFTQAGTNTAFYTDASAKGAGPYLYRVGVQQ
jgi:hypothetical protein